MHAINSKNGARTRSSASSAPPTGGRRTGTIVPTTMLCYRRSLRERKTGSCPSGRQTKGTTFCSSEVDLFAPPAWGCWQLGGLPTFFSRNDHPPPTPPPPPPPPPPHHHIPRPPNNPSKMPPAPKATETTTRSTPASSHTNVPTPTALLQVRPAPDHPPL